MDCGIMHSRRSNGNMTVSCSDYWCDKQLLLRLTFLISNLGDWQAGKIPEDFEQSLLKFYREYLDDKGRVIRGREKNLEAFQYFVDRVLPSINCEVNKYGPVERKTKNLSQCFTITDEALGLALVENYCRAWHRKNLIKESNKRALLLQDEDGNGRGNRNGGREPHEMPPEWSYARWSGSQEGKRCSGWSEEGVNRFSEHARKIMELRKGLLTGEKLEEYLIDYWNGILKETKQRKKQKRVEAFEEDIFGGRFASV